MTSPSADPPGTEPDEQRIGGRIRALRNARGLSLRALADRLDISASALSQIERGKMRPSVTRLYQIMSELGEPMSAVFEGEEEVSPGGAPAAGTPPDGSPDGGGPGWNGPPVAQGPAAAPPSRVLSDHVAVTRADDAAVLELHHGVRYRRLTPEQVPGMSYFESTYPPGAFSSQNAEYVRHSGHEIGLVVSGELVVDTGFDTHRLGPGDTISYPSTTPHRISNQSDVPAVAIWLNLP
ncbi:helix-turn-helix domain-containing protein [Nocardiopsis aegyptia]|uniref:DNA-binding XRE family transcriptional regulator/quercetin dioxygenase-like cupin family protein n=1 Tax=Nocardiopsis aegyptia TaxID=220378 RepID=A0A7Z0JC33_9ACTN|nr:cupin domain-containing protein [Nocardiopsis aegyptia]NYJ36064.1 DNA-binding XRE family transcriptional regulator/quercetin dioxygenase-like cupin family protein [Nocardiopsis aegyptia]